MSGMAEAIAEAMQKGAGAETKAGPGGYRVP